MSSNYSYETLQLIEPNFKSPLTDLIIELDHLRKKKLGGSTHPSIFFQLKGIFHLLESLESARIEGNRTTLAELIDEKMGADKLKGEELAEIENVGKAMGFIEENVDTTTPIDRRLISEIHKIVVGGLSPEKEGDKTPGAYRETEIKISKAAHIPPATKYQIEDYMEELFKFINSDTPSKYDLLKTALVHHRFVWIHPFRNGNGRTVRLLTYALLVKQGFNVKVGRILNPAAIFCNDRQKYYDFLGRADTGKKEELLAWCEYVLSGLKIEIEKIDRLLDYSFLTEKILLPALSWSLGRKIITPLEEKILKVAITKQRFQASDLKVVLPDKIPAEVSRILRGLKEKNMISPTGEKTRKYYIHFFNSFLLRGVIHMLVQNGFVPLKEE